jgi:hypothetical protein
LTSVETQDHAELEETSSNNDLEVTRRAAQTGGDDRRDSQGKHESKPQPEISRDTTMNTESSRPTPSDQLETSSTRLMASKDSQQAQQLCLVTDQIDLDRQHHNQTESQTDTVATVHEITSADEQREHARTAVTAKTQLITVKGLEEGSLVGLTIILRQTGREDIVIEADLT